MNLQKSVKAAWIDFIICLFFGVYGVHKFREKKIGIGILYLLTFGLLCFGWLYDCAKLLVIAVCITLPHTKANGNNTKEQGEIWNHYYTLAKKIALIVVIIFLLFFFIAVACAPNNESTSIPTTESTTVPTTEPTTAPTTEPTTEPTTAPTTEPTTAPTTEPTTDPPHVHSFSPATCTEPKTCSCGTTEGKAKGHNYANGVCSECNTKDPNYSEITYVLNTKSKKFHRTSCGSLPTENRKDTTMSRDEVIAQGYDPCGRCHP